MIRAFLARVEEDHDVGEVGRDGLRNLSTVDVEVVVEAGRGRGDVEGRGRGRSARARRAREGDGALRWERGWSEVQR